MLIDGDDDLIVDLEEVEEDFTPEDTTVEEAKGKGPVIDELPDYLQDDADESFAAKGAKAAKEVDEDASDEDDPYARAQAAEERIRAVEANAIWQEAQARAALAEGHRNQISVALDALTLRRTHAENILALAEDSGDSAGRRAAEKELRSISEIETELRTSLGRVGNPDAILAEGRSKYEERLSQQPKGKTVGAGITARHPLAERWANQNGWMKTNRSANRFVIAQSQAMANEGWDMNSPTFYAELSKRVGNAYPGIKVSTLQATKKAPGKGQVKSPVAPTRSASGNPSSAVATGKRYVLTAQEQATMRRLNLDPTNKLHRTHFAKSRMESARRAQS